MMIKGSTVSRGLPGIDIADVVLNAGMFLIGDSGSTQLIVSEQPIEEALKYNELLLLKGM